METVSVIAIITSISSLLIIFAKTIKKSSCCGGNCETRTPQPSINIIEEQHKDTTNTNDINNKRILPKTPNYVKPVINEHPI